MNKIVLIEKTLENAKIFHEKQEITVIPYISHNDQIAMINAYISAYFGEDGSQDRITAETVNKIATLDILTNISIDGMAGEELRNFIDYIVASGTWEKITKAIRNWREYDYNLNIAVESKKKENSDIGFIFSKLINEKINPLIEKFSNMDFSDEKLFEMKNLVGEVSKQLNPETPIGSLISNGTI